jgi:predicted aminopeptidase
MRQGNHHAAFSFLTEVSMRPLRRVEQGIVGIAILLLLGLSGCSTAAYVTRLGIGQAKVLLFSRSNEDVFKDPSVSQETKDRINLLLEVKHYAEGRIGLEKTGNYSRYFEVGSQGLLYVISACPKDSLNPYQWTFPIVGKMSYKGFFRLRDAEKEREKLEKAGYDTCLRKAWAYSTLGWFEDPIFSTMLHQERAVIAQIVIHELTHATLFIEDHLDFNEQMATFIGNQGAIDFFSERNGRDSPDYWNARNILDDELIFGKFIGDICASLRELYSSGLSRERKLELRERTFRKAKKDFRRLKAKLKTRLYFGFEDEALNNAILLSYWQYIGGLELFNGLYHLLDEDLSKMIAFLKEVHRSGEDPRELVQRRLLGKPDDIQ